MVAASSAAKTKTTVLLIPDEVEKSSNDRAPGQ